MRPVGLVPLALEASSPVLVGVSAFRAPGASLLVLLEVSAPPAPEVHAPAVLEAPARPVPKAPADTPRGAVATFA